MNFITKLALKRQLKKWGYSAERGFVPFSKVRRAIVLFDVQDAEFDECQRVAGEYFKEKGIEMKPFFLDMGKHGKDDIIVTGVKTTILRRNLSFCGTLPAGMIEEVRSSEADLCICLAHSDCTAVRSFLGIVRAPFCIGVMDYTGAPYSFVLSPAENGKDSVQVNFHDSLRCLRSICDYIEKIV